VVVGNPTGMHLRDDDVQELSHEQQGGGYAHDVRSGAVPFMTSLS
jgi:hypothetical protein